MGDDVRLPLLHALRLWHRNFSSFSGVADGSGIVLEAASAIYVLGNVGPFDEEIELTRSDVEKILTGQFDVGASEHIYLPSKAHDMDAILAGAKAKSGKIAITGGMCRFVEVLPTSTSITVFSGEGMSLLHAVRDTEQVLISFTEESAEAVDNEPTDDCCTQDDLTGTAC